MTKRPWTGGPWRVDGARPHVVLRIADKTHLLRIASANPSLNPQANARLIAAAPDLYEALEMARDQLNAWVDAVHWDEALEDETLVKTIPAIDAALAKAGGAS